MSKQVVINTCYGGFGLSNKAMEMYLTRVGKVPFYRYDRYGTSTYASKPFVNDKSIGEYYHTGDIGRDDPDLVFVVQSLGAASASGYLSKLKIVEVPDDVEWKIHNHDGMESVSEKSNSWY